MVGVGAVHAFTSGPGIFDRAPRGRKHDFKDAERLVRRLIAKELILSFVPEGEQRIWRSMTRMKRCKLNHSGRADTGRRKHIGGFLLGNFHKGMNHDGIELRAATLYQTSPGVFM